MSFLDLYEGRAFLAFLVIAALAAAGWAGVLPEGLRDLLVAPEDGGEDERGGIAPDRAGGDRGEGV